MAAFPRAASADEAKWPNRPVRIIVPFAPGGSTDILARYVASVLSAHFKQSFVADNRTGASGNIGAEAAVRSAPDGYTLLFTSSNILMMPGLGEVINYDVLTDLSPITMLASAPMVLFKSPQVKPDNLRALIDDIRSKPGTYSFSSSGNGGSPHLAGEIFRVNEKLDMVHVPYRGAAPALADVASGQVQLTFTTYISARSLVAANRLIPIAVASKKRSAALPEIPTFAEAGATPMDIGSGFCLFAPAGTPTDVLQNIYAVLAAARRTPEFDKQMADVGADVVLSSPEAFSKDARAEVELWKTVIPKFIKTTR